EARDLGRSQHPVDETDPRNGAGHEIDLLGRKHSVSNADGSGARPARGGARSPARFYAVYVEDIEPRRFIALRHDMIERAGGGIVDRGCGASAGSPISQGGAHVRIGRSNGEGQLAGVSALL